MSKGWDVIGIGNALMDALVVLPDDDGFFEALGLTRGMMHPVDHDGWMKVFERVRHLEVQLDSGGSCANTIATLGRLGARVTYRGQVGDDDLGRTYTERLLDACGTHRLRTCAQGGATGKCLSLVSPTDAERTMVTDLGAAVGLSDLGEVADDLEHTRVAHFTGYTLLDGPPHDVVIDAMARAKRAGALVSLDVADPFVVQAIRDRLWHVLERYVDVVFLNAEEARSLTDEAPEDAAEAIARQAGVSTIVVKLGSRGSVVWHEGNAFPVQIERVKAIDTTGAGDAYAGGFLYGLLEGWPLADAGRLGSAVAALTVSQLGAVVKDRSALAAAVERLRPRAA